MLHGLSSSCGEQGLLSSCGTHVSCCGGFFYCRAWALGCTGFSSCGTYKLSSCGAQHTRLSCSTACEIFPGQGLNLCLLHWQADSSPLRHQGSPIPSFTSLSMVSFSLLHIFLGLPWLSGKESNCQYDPLEKEMVTHSSILAGEISGTEEPGRLEPMGSQKSGTQLSN